ncbi:DUF1120 domain-containing protein [Yersinia mollaretii]|uniref:DUF1120 domain-containing protein n=1 Tax=Yersinia mollaretii TaxID=33060 RepID=UPI0011A46C7E|nr:DUF1120 domain-containing protein [Yersinia mollaretii]
MKNKLAQITVLSSLIFGINTANADAPTAELKVVGSLKVPGCTIVAPDNGVYDLGRLSSSLIKSGTATTTLPAITKNWTVNCDAETYLNFTPIDNRKASTSVPSTTNFGMGSVNGTGKIGYYTAQMKNGTVNGKPSNVFSSASTAFAATTTANLTTGLRTGWSSAANTQSVGKVFTADIMVIPVLAGTTTMGGPITEDAKIDGSLTMNFAFGI